MWYEKTLSLGGKDVLLKSVALALPVYAMSCFKLTKNQCKKITSAMTQFWWNSIEGKRKIPWVAWKTLCKSKKNGGLGFKDLVDFNQSLLAKQAWRVLHDPDSLLARIYKARYFPRSDFLSYGVGTRPSYAWKSLIHGRELLKRVIMRAIGNGQDTHVWIDKWVMDDNPRRPVSNELFIDLNLRVADLIDEGGSWNITKVTDLFPMADSNRIRTLSPSLNKSDYWIWPYTKSGMYTIKWKHVLREGKNTCGRHD